MPQNSGSELTLWEKVKKRKRAIVVVSLFSAVLLSILVMAIRADNWARWTGFGKQVKVEDQEPGKTLWDWLDLLGVPLTLAILGYILQQQERSRAETLKEQERERAEKIAKEEILQVYFDRLSTLLVDKNILAIAVKVHPLREKQGTDQPEITITPEERELLDSAIDVIRARTLSILRRFEGDTEKKSSAIRFLIDADVISKAKLSLSGANLSGADLSSANLSEANLNGANLSKANISGANISGANVNSADLDSANLRNASLRNASLRNASLRGANLLNTDLHGANLLLADLRSANLHSANLSGAEVHFANLHGANLDNVKWNEGTQWPDAAEVARAKNLPDALKQQLGITDTPPPDPVP
jgi:hypothetical protein